MTLDTIHHRFLSCSGACTDTRKIESGSMFFALKGPSFDANTFAGEALGKEARYAVVDDPRVATDDRYILVPDVLTTLQDLGRHHRRTFSGPVLAITGTNGKTTTKELVRAVLAQQFPTLATEGNLNNHIGVPLTLLRIRPEHRVAVIEMGANKPGDIAELCSIAEPTHGLITNIGKAHLEGFGGYEGVLRTKTELYDHIEKNKGTLFVNGDDDVLKSRARAGSVITYGRSAHSQVRGRVLSDGPFLRVGFDGRDGRQHLASTRLIGDYNLPNALAAIAIGQHFGGRDTGIADALTNYRPGNSRSQFMDTGRNQLVLDAYNANPTSMAAALENFAAMKSDRPKLAILGDMLELGTVTEEEHRTITNLVDQLRIETRFVGKHFKAVASGTMDAFYPDAQALARALEVAPISGHLILLKASRGTRLEDVVPAL